MEDEREALAQELKEKLQDPEWVAALSRAASYLHDECAEGEAFYQTTSERRMLSAIHLHASSLWRFLERTPLREKLREKVAR